MSARIVITGLGVVSPVGIGKQAFWDAIVAGESGIRPISSFDAEAYGIRRGGEVPGFDPLAFMAAETAATVGLAAQYALASARLALEDAGLDPQALPKEAVGVSVGTTMGESQLIEQATRAWREGGFEAAPAGTLAQLPAYMIPAQVAAEWGFAGPNAMIPTACAAGNYAIGHALDQLRAGRASLMLAGGVDPMSQIAYTGFHKVNSMATEVPRPFSADREGMMVSAGAGMLVLETLDAARARGARIYAEVLGYGLSCDAHHMTAPHPEGLGAYRAMADALASTGLAATAIDYINAHGTGTQANDRTETLAVKKLLGDRAGAVPISSIKAMLGHTLGAASALEAIACALVVSEGVIPPTANYSAPDPECDLDYVPHTARRQPVRVAMSNSYAFGGNDASLIVARVGA